MNWKKNEGALALHQLISETLQDSKKLRNVGDHLFHSSDIKSFFDGLDINNHRSISLEDLVLFCLEMDVKLRPRQLHAVKEYFALDRNTSIDFFQFLSCLWNQNSKVPLENNYHPQGRTINYVFAEFLSLVIEQRQNRERLLLRLATNVQQLQKFFQENFYQYLEKDVITKDIVKEFMYDSGSYSRPNFWLISDEFFNKNRCLNLPSVIKATKNDFGDEQKIGRLCIKNTTSIPIDSTKERSQSKVKLIKTTEFNQQNEIPKLISIKNQEGHIRQSQGLDTSKGQYKVSSILEQIENIQRALDEKRSRNTDRHQIFQIEEAKRQKVVGQIINKSKVDEDNKTQTKLIIQTTRPGVQEESQKTPLQSNNSIGLCYQLQKRSENKQKSNFYINQVKERSKWEHKDPEENLPKGTKIQESAIKKRDEILERASSEAKLKIQEIQRRALERVYSRPKIGTLGTKPYDFKVLQRRIEDTMDKYRSRDRFDQGWKRDYSYTRLARDDNLRILRPV